MLTNGLYVRYGRRRFPVASLQEAAEKWNAMRDHLNTRCLGGASMLGNGCIVVDATNKKIARISYNGRIWEEGSKYFQ